MMKFICDQCGLCCQNLHLNPEYKDLDDGTGVCRYYNKENRLCEIYEHRPLKCNVESGYEIFKDTMTYKEYLDKNYAVCRILKEGL